MESGLLETPDAPASALPGDDDPLRAVAEWGCTVLTIPSAIWLLGDDDQTLKIHAFDGLLPECQNWQAMRGDRSVVAEVIETGHLIRMENIPHDRRFHDGDYAKRAGLVSLIAIPIFCRGRTRGVIEAFPLQGDTSSAVLEEKLIRLAKLAELNLEIAARSSDARQMVALERGSARSRISSSPCARS